MKQADSQKGQAAQDPAERRETAGEAPSAGAPPSPWIQRFAGLVAPGGQVLDLACGAGRHSRLFSDRGHRVLAVDRDVSRLESLAEQSLVEVMACDLEAGGVPVFLSRRFDAVVITNYLHRPLMPAILAALAPGGLLLYETFAQGNEKYGRPRNPDFLLQPGELLTWFGKELRVLAYEDLEITQPKPAVIQRICARRP